MGKIIQKLTKPRFINVGVPLETSVEISLPQIAARILISIITAGWITSIPFYLFVIFMHENAFFSYDFFIDGVFGIYTFIIVSALFLVLLSLSLYGFLIFAKLGFTEQRRSNKNTFRWLTWFFFLISCLLHLTFFMMALEGGKLKVFFWLMSISIIFCAFFYSFAGHGFRKNAQNWISPLIFIMASMFLPFANQDITSEVVAMGLRGFNVGGGKNVEILQANNKVPLSGKLTLLSPHNIYLKDSQGKLLIIPVSDNTKIKVW